MNAPTRYPPQKGVWTLIAPDGRKWEGSSGLEVAGMEQRERIPASVALERIYRALDGESPRMETVPTPEASIVEAFRRSPRRVPEACGAPLDADGVERCERAMDHVGVCGLDPI